MVYFKLPRKCMCEKIQKVESRGIISPSYYLWNKNCPWFVLL